MAWPLRNLIGLLLVGNCFPSIAEVATPSLTFLRSELLRAHELVRLTGKARDATNLPELVDALRNLDLIQPHIFNTSLALNPTTLRNVTLEEVKSLELLAKRLVDTLQVSVDEAKRLESMVNRSQELMDLTRGVGPCRKRARASTWLAQLRPKLPQKLQEVQNLQRLLQTMKQHLKRIEEEALMGDVMLNTTAKLHQESVEHERQARSEYQSALKALTRVNRLVKDHIFNLEAESDEPVHNRSLLQIPEDPFTAPFLKDKGAKVKKPCKKEALPNHTLGTADSMPIPVAMQHPLPQNPPVTSTTATITVTITHLSSTSIKAMEPDPAPDMPRIFIPGTRDPDMEDVKAPSTTLATTSRKPSPATTTSSTSTSTDQLEYVMDETLEVLMAERHRLGKVILNINRDMVSAKNRTAGLLKARLVAEDAAVQLQTASKDHLKAVTLVEGQRNATEQKMQSLRGQIRIFAAAVERLQRCLDPEEKEKRQLYLQQRQEEEKRIAEGEVTLNGLSEHASVMWSKVESSLGKLQAMRDGLWLEAILDGLQRIFRAQVG